MHRGGVRDVAERDKKGGREIHLPEVVWEFDYNEWFKNVWIIWWWYSDEIVGEGG
jgi:hypothetical protein